MNAPLVTPKLAVIVGAYDESLDNFLGAVRAGNRPELVRQFGIMSQHQRAVKAENPRLAATLGKANDALRAVMEAAAKRRVEKTANFLERPTHIISVCFDGIATGVSGIATVGAPFSGLPWKLIDIVSQGQAADAAAPMRVVSLKIAGVEHVVTSNVAFSSGPPTSPGIDVSVFSSQAYTSQRPSAHYRPWALRAGMLKSDATIALQLYNPSLTAQSCNFSLMVQATPCGDNDQYDEKLTIPFGSAKFQQFKKALAGLSFYRG